MRTKVDKSLPPQAATLGGIMTEAEIDETLAGSFPASDPPRRRGRSALIAEQLKEMTLCSRPSRRTEP
jgi:hypothetical protein